MHLPRTRLNHIIPALLIAGLLLIAGQAAFAATTVRLPSSLCGAGAGDALFTSGFQTQSAIPSTPSGGNGGAVGGNVARSILVSAVSRTFYLYVPSSYTPTHPTPLLLALHGTSGSAAASPGAAQTVRSNWSALAESSGFIVLAPAGTQAQGGWTPSTDGAIMEAALDDTFALYNIEQSRIYLWGFSAGAHLAHALALTNTTYFAAYAVSAGGLTQFACSDTGSPSCTSLLGSAVPKIPVHINLGNTDPLYTTYGAGNDPTRFTNAGWVLGSNLVYTLFNGGHTYNTAQLPAIWADLCPWALAP
ncbi:MAG: PHB depolymerase family esterase [Tahibacter sp.]